MYIIRISKLININFFSQIKMTLNEYITFFPLWSNEGYFTFHCQPLSVMNK